jgi:hypothetical protein
MPRHPIYQLYAELNEYRPTMWRRFQVAGNITVARLAYIVMTLFEMKASHLFTVEVPWNENVCKKIRKECPEWSDSDIEKIPEGVQPVWYYEVPNLEPCEDPEIKISDATKETLSKAIQHEGDRLSLNYDFGDNWWISLTLESVTVDAALPGAEFPRVLEGAGFGIIEDCGGVTGLMELRKAFTKKRGELYQELRTWLGVVELDMAFFDIDDMNFRLKKLPRIYKQLYEDRRTPTQRSIDLIERNYRK